MLVILITKAVCYIFFVIIIRLLFLFSGTDGGTLLGAIAGLGALLLVFLLYIKNKRWWWSSVGGMGCCDEACPPVSSRPVPSPPVPATSFTPAPLKHKLGMYYLVRFSFITNLSTADCIIFTVRYKSI
jgi:hypothetical protein